MKAFFTVLVLALASFNLKAEGPTYNFYFYGGDSSSAQIPSREQAIPETEQRRGPSIGSEQEQEQVIETIVTDEEVVTGFVPPEPQEEQSMGHQYVPSYQVSHVSLGAAVALNEAMALHLSLHSTPRWREVRYESARQARPVRRTVYKKEICHGRLGDYHCHRGAGAYARSYSRPSGIRALPTPPKKIFRRDWERQDSWRAKIPPKSPSPWRL